MPKIYNQFAHQTEHRTVINGQHYAAFTVPGQFITIYRADEEFKALTDGFEGVWTIRSEKMKWATVHKLCEEEARQHFVKDKTNLRPVGISASETPNRSCPKTEVHSMRTGLEELPCNDIKELSAQEIKNIDDLWARIGRHFYEGINNVTKDTQIKPENLINFLANQGMSEANQPEVSWFKRHWLDVVVIVGFILLLALGVRALRGFASWTPPIRLDGYTTITKSELSACSTYLGIPCRSSLLKVHGEEA